jgi:membrane-associated phospholipid phosphatase
MPFLALLLIAVAAGAATLVAAGRYPRRAAGLPATAEAAGTLGREAGQRARFVRVLARRLDPAAATGLALTLALALVVAGGVLLAVTAYLVRSNAALAHIDQGVARWGYDNAAPASTRGLKAVTTLAETWFVLLAGLALAVTETIRTRTRWAVPFLLVVVLGNNLLTTAVKELAHRVRPDLNPLAATLGPSFPSGHTSTAAAFYAAAALLLGRRRGTAAQAWLAAGAVGIAVGVACSRVLLDVHWLSDVVAGLMLGWAWFALCAIAFGGRLLRFGAAAEKAAEGAKAAARDARSAA